MSITGFQDSSPEFQSQADLESELTFDIAAITRWIDRLPVDIKKALLAKGGNLYPTPAAEKFRFPETLIADNALENLDVIEAFGHGGRLWLLSRIFRISWPHSAILAQDILEAEEVGQLLKDNLLKLSDPIALRMMRFLLSCKEFRQGMKAIANMPAPEPESD